MASTDEWNSSTVYPFSVESTYGVLEVDPRPTAARATYIFIDFLATLVFNILTILVTRSVDDFSESTKVLMTSLAVSDLGMAPIVLLSFIGEINGDWPFPQWVQYVHYFGLHTLTSISALVLLCLNGDRFILVTRPLRHSLLITKKRAVRVLILICTGFIISGILLCYFNNISYESSTALSRLDSYDAATAVYLSLVTYMIPLLGIVVFNSRLLMISFSQSRKMRVARAVDGAHQQMITVRGKAVFVFTVISFAFAVSWMLYMLELFLILLQSGHYPVWLQFTSAWLAVSNSWWNFIIYGLLNRSFRNSVKIEISKNIQSVRQLVGWHRE